MYFKMQPKRYLVIFVVAAFLHQCAAYIEGPEREENALIPETLLPLEYVLLFEVDVIQENPSFLGTAIIWLECLKSTNEIILNMKDLILEHNSPVTVMKELPNSQFETLITRIPEQNLGKEWLIIGLEKVLEVKDRIQILLKYQKLKNRSQKSDAAFVKYNYIRKGDRRTKWVAVSLPGAVNARRLYPCIDNPELKAKVHMKVAYDEKFKSLSNTNIINDQIERKRGADSRIFVSAPYQITPPLSTFSTGFVIGEFKEAAVKIEESTGVQIRVWSDEVVMEKMDFAAETAANVIQFYWEYFNGVLAPYPIDIVAVPYYGRTDKWNYGLIILEESLIVNDDPSTQVREMQIAFLLCDVFCHQYFGLQTTFKTWSENWLNMGLALFYRIPCLGNMFSNQETSIANTHLVEAFIRVLSVKAEIKSRPVMVPDSRVDLTKLFEDTILADKAYFLVRMMSYILGTDVLTEQVKTFWTEFRFEAASLERLWEKFPLGGMNKALLPNSMTFKNIMDSWTSKLGFANIKMTRISSSKVKIQQEFPVVGGSTPRLIPLNFITKSESKQKSIEKNKPVSKAASKRPVEGSESIKQSHQEEPVQYWLHSESIEISVKKKSWIILNSKLNVLCRVEYDLITLRLIKKTLTDINTYELIDVTSRTQFISDLFAAGERGKLSYKEILPFISYLKHEKSPLPMMVALHELNRIRIALFGTDIFPRFQKYILTILKHIITERNFNIRHISEYDYDEYYFQKIIFTSACTFRDEDCVQESKIHFRSLIRDGDLSERTDKIPAVLREPMYCQAIKEGGELEWDFLILQYVGEYWENEFKNIILNALACSADSNIIKKYLERILSPQDNTLKDRLTIFKSVASNETGYNLAETFFQDNIEEILRIELNSNDNNMVYRYLEILYENTWKQEDFDELEGFVPSHVPLANIEVHLKDSRQIALKNISWLNNMKVEIPKFFEEGETENGFKTFFQR